jgi:2-dehydro-3-deoxygalactonokinase
MTDWSQKLIAVDWGTSNRRAYLLAPDGTVLDRMEDGRGVTSVEQAEFPSAVAEIERRLGGHPMLLAGMIGSNRGWLEAPYVACPATVSDVAARLVLAGGSAAAIVPGLSYVEGGRGDVMRGEEVQIFGLMALPGAADSLTICHPGTHTKWARTSGDSIDGFRTVMTGEMFGLLRDHSILAPLMQGEVDPGEAFARGVAAAYAGAGLTSELFSLRSGALLSLLAPGDALPMASGLLIGADLREGLGWSRPPGEVVVLGRPSLTRLYAAAILAVGGQARQVDGAAAFVAGMQFIRKRMS